MVAKKHGINQRTRSYSIWVGMRRRVRHPERPGSECYAGVTIDPAWDDYLVFLADMGEPPPGFSIDRIDGTKGYGPDNCRWVDSTTQRRNRRDRLPPMGVAYARGMKGLMSQDDIAKVLGCSQPVVSFAIRGFSGYGKNRVNAPYWPRGKKFPPTHA